MTLVTQIVFLGLFFCFVAAPLAQADEPISRVDAPPTAPLTPAPMANASPTPSPTPLALSPQGLSIKQIDLDGRRVVAEVNAMSTPVLNSHYIAVENGQDCFLLVTSVREKVVQLDGLQCPFFNSLKLGQSLEPSLFEDKVAPPVLGASEARTDDRLRLAISPYFGSGASLESNDLYYNQPNQLTSFGSANLTMRPAGGVALEVYRTPTNGFGWSAGLSYDFQRNISGVDAYANGTFIGGSFYAPNTSLSLVTMYGNAVYRFTDFYIPFGLNYTIPILQGGTNAYGSTSLYGDIGLQIAFGYILTDHIALEFWLESLVLDGNTSTVNGTLNYNGLSFDNPEFRIRFSF